MLRSFFLLILAAVFSCTNSGQSSESANDSTSVAIDSTQLSSIKVPTSPWIIPLTDYWKDQDHFVFYFPEDGPINLFSVPTFDQQPVQLFDTLQGKILKIQNDPTKGDCDSHDIYQVELGKDKQRGWLNFDDLYTINRLNMGTYTTPIGDLKLGEMKLISRRMGQDCSTIRLLFFYDDSNLYLIDRTAMEDNSLYWREGKHLSLVDATPGIWIQGQTVGDLFEAKWGVPNGKVTFRVKFKGDHLYCDLYDMVAVEGDAEDGEVQEDDSVKN